MEKHIQQFNIHAYKGIHDLTLDHLNSINILTGDNNSGKTSVLDFQVSIIPKILVLGYYVPELIAYEVETDCILMAFTICFLLITT